MLSLKQVFPHFSISYIIITALRDIQFFYGYWPDKGMVMLKKDDDAETLDGGRTDKLFMRC